MPREDQKEVARRLIVALVAQGDSADKIRAKICKTFSVDESFVRELMRDIGASFRRDMQDEDMVDFHIMAVVDRLGRRAEANMENQVGNRADEALIKTYEYMRRRTLDDEKKQADYDLSAAKRLLIQKNADSLETQGDLLLVRPDLLQLGEGDVEDAEVIEETPP